MCKVKWFLWLLRKNRMRGFSRGYTPQRFTNRMAQLLCRRFPRGMLLHLVLIAVRATGMATPKAILAELIVVALLASVPETHHTLTPAVGALHGMEDILNMGKPVHER